MGPSSSTNTYHHPTLANEDCGQSVTTSWPAFHKETGEEVTVIYDILNRSSVVIGADTQVFTCPIESLTSTPPLPAPSCDECATDWEKAYLSDYLSFHHQVIGETGETGVVGEKGEVGLQGARGPHGPIGIPGDPGEIGPVGENGPRGSRGSKGRDGQCLCPDDVVPSSSGSGSAEEGCPASLTLSGFGQDADGNPTLSPGASGTIRVSWHSCTWGSVIYVRWGRTGGAGCSARADFLNGSPGYYYGNINSESGSYSIHLHNPGDTPCSIVDPTVSIPIRWEG